MKTFAEIKDMYIELILERMKNLDGELADERTSKRATFKEFGSEFSINISIDKYDNVRLFSGIGGYSFDNKSVQAFIVRKYCVFKENEGKAKKIAELKRQIEELEK